MSTETQADPEMPEQTLRQDSVLVRDQGRLAPSSQILDHLGLEAGDMAVVRIHLDDGETATITRELDTRRRLTIPHLVRYDHGIEEGDHVDIEVGAA